MRRKVLLAALSVLLTLMALEIGWRIYVANFGTERQRALYLYSRAQIAAETSLFRALPFVNYGLSPAHDEVNAQGYRGPVVKIPKPPGIFRIVSLGGSTTYGAFLDSYEKTYPHQLQLELAEAYGLDHIEVVNAGVPGYSSWETAVNFLLRIQDLDPDLITVYHAVNDLETRLVSPESYSGGYEARGTWRLPEAELPASALQRLVMRKLGRAVELEIGLNDYFSVRGDIGKCRVATDLPEPVCRTLDVSVAELFSANPPIYFERNLSNIISMARQLEIKALLLTWAYSPYKYDTPFGDVMIHDSFQREIARHNDMIRKLAAARGTLFLDAAEQMPIDREYWFSGIHKTLTGTREMARLMASYLVSSGALS